MASNSNFRISQLLTLQVFKLKWLNLGDFKLGDFPIRKRLNLNAPDRRYSKFGCFVEIQKMKQREIKLQYPYCIKT